MAMISVVISEELRLELTEYKSELNISSVCREALKEEIERRKRLSHVTKVPSSVVKKLRSEKLELSNKWFRFGQEDAEKLFSSGILSFEEVQRLIYGKEAPKALGDGFKKRYKLPAGRKKDYIALLVRGVHYVKYQQGFSAEIKRLLDDFDEVIEQ